MNDYDYMVIMKYETTNDHSLVLSISKENTNII